MAWLVRADWLSLWTLHFTRAPEFLFTCEDELPALVGCFQSARLAAARFYKRGSGLCVCSFLFLFTLHCSSGRLTDACVTLRFDHEIKTHHEVLQCFHLLPAPLVIPAFLPYCDLSLDQERRTSSKFIGSLRPAILEIRCEESDG
jgi:hypothetical protein